MPAYKPLRERFEAFVSPEPMSGCWLWTGYRNACGYGVIRVERGTALAHRVAWELSGRELPEFDGFTVSSICHRCDNPACVNPEHLFLGSFSDNIRDASAKGRMRQNKVTHCPQGHAYAGANLVVNARGRRVCRACNAAKAERHRNKLMDQDFEAYRIKKTAQNRAAYLKRKAAACA